MFRVNSFSWLQTWKPIEGDWLVYQLTNKMDNYRVRPCLFVALFRNRAKNSFQDLFHKIKVTHFVSKIVNWFWPSIKLKTICPLWPNNIGERKRFLTGNYKFNMVKVLLTAFRQVTETTETTESNLNVTVLAKLTNFILFQSYCYAKTCKQQKEIIKPLFW